MQRLRFSLAAGLVCIALPLAAQEPPPPPPVAPEPAPPEARPTPKIKPSRYSREGDKQLSNGKPADAAKTYERGFVFTKDPVYLRRAGEAYLAIGPEGRKDARTAFQLYRQNARDDAERADADRLLLELDALEKPPEPPPPPEPEAPPPPPPPPPPAEPPPTAPIDRIGDAKWSPTLGFVEPSEPAPPVKDEAGGGGVSVPGTVDLGLSGAGIAVSVGVATLNPINDGVTDDETALDVLELGFHVRAEFRTQTSLIAPWFDLGGWFFVGEKEETEPATTEVVLSVTGLRAQGRFGIDVQPATFVGGGPFVGYRLDAFDADLERIEEPSNDPITDNDLETDSGLLYGLHVRFRTKETATSPPVFFIDPSLTWRTGKHITGTYGGVELGLRAGGFVTTAFFERRLSASGKFGTSDVEDLSQAFAKSMPVEQRFGVSIGGFFDGRG